MIIKLLIYTEKGWGVLLPLFTYFNIFHISENDGNILAY